MRVKTGIKGGRLAANHNETLLRARPRAKGLRVKTGLRAGKLAANHNETHLAA